MGLRNRFVTLRHGQSVANVQRVVASGPRLGVPRFGLTPLGRRQVLDSVRAYVENHPGRATSTVVYSSDFSRALHTAALAVQSGIATGPVRPAYGLRERHFGAFEGDSADCYPLIWERDAVDAEHQWREVESVAMVAERMLRLVEWVERSHRDMTVVLVGHADPLKILHATVSGINPGLHHQALPLMENAEFREVDSTSL